MRTPASLALAVALSLATSAPAVASSLDMTLIRRILRGAAPAVARCAADHALPPGGYTVVITVPPGGPLGIELPRAPDGLAPRGAACIRAAYATVRFPRIGAGDQAIRLIWPFELR